MGCSQTKYSQKTGW